MFAKNLKTAFKTTVGATVIALGALASAPSANGGVIQLGFIIDESGSIGSGNYNTIKNGLANAINNFIPTNGQYEISVISFASGTQNLVSNVLINSVAARTAVANAVLADTFTGGGTNMTGAFNAMNSLLLASTLEIDASYVNLGTDGVANSPTNAAAARNNLIGTGVGQAGVDNISIEAIGGGVDATFLQNSICYPGPCDTTFPYNFPTQGFYIAVANAEAYAGAIAEKIQTVVDATVPAPAPIALFGLGLAAMGFVRRRIAA
jgi:hypothetical protein